MTERGDGRVYLRGKTLWISYYLRGKNFRESAHTGDEKQARKFLKHRLDEVGADKVGAREFAGPQQERVLVNELLDDLVAEYKRGSKKKRIPREVSPQMESYLKKVREFFGEMRAMQVRSRHVQDFIGMERSNGKANATINRSLELLIRAYNIAMEADEPKQTRMPNIKEQMLDESENVRKGKFTPHEAELVFASLPGYMADVARFAYEAGSRSGEIRKLKWSYLEDGHISVPATDTKNRKPRTIALTPELEAIIAHREKARVDGCDLIFHRDGKRISDYRKCWRRACVANGLGAYFCRDCRDDQGRLISRLDAKSVCPRCHKKGAGKYVGRLVHDFRRSAAYETWKAGSSIQDCMKVTGHASESMFNRYKDLFTEEEERQRQLETQQRRNKWKEAQASSSLLEMPVTRTQ
jgi:integrase